MKFLDFLPPYVTSKTKLVMTVIIAFLSGCITYLFITQEVYSYMFMSICLHINIYTFWAWLLRHKLPPPHKKLVDEEVMDIFKKSRQKRYEQED
jgi:hypothetical protein